MKESAYKSYEDLPLFLNAELVAQAAAATVRLAGERPAILVTHDEAAAALLGWPVRHFSG